MQKYVTSRKKFFYVNERIDLIKFDIFNCVMHF